MQQSQGCNPNERNEVAHRSLLFTLGEFEDGAHMSTATCKSVFSFLPRSPPQPTRATRQLPLVDGVPFGSEFPLNLVEQLRVLQKDVPQACRNLV
jgi:hypothetical protein